VKSVGDIVNEVGIPLVKRLANENLKIIESFLLEEFTMNLSHSPPT